MLQVEPKSRPDIYQLFYSVCKFRNVPYTLAIVKQTNQTPTPYVLFKNNSDVPITASSPFKEVTKVEDMFASANPPISPMRRGRPTKSNADFGFTSSSDINPISSSGKLRSSQSMNSSLNLSDINRFVK